MNTQSTTQNPDTIDRAEFIALCENYGGPDEIPLSLLPKKIGVRLSMADRFFDDAEEAADFLNL